MPRGINKRVVEIKNPKSDYFERAILFLKNTEEKTDGEIELLSGEYIKYLSTERKRKHKISIVQALIFGFIGMIFGGIIIYLIK